MRHGSTDRRVADRLLTPLVEVAGAVPYPPGGDARDTMDTQKQARVARFGMAASIATAFGASICCIGPIVAVMFGMTSLAALAKYEPLRPIFGVVTAALLTLAFYMTYKRPAEAACDPESICATQGLDRMQKINRAAVWTAAIVAVAMFTFPSWSGWIVG